jgi:Domain of unknown function (DUF4340)
VVAEAIVTRGRSFLVLVAIAAALGAYIYFVERKRTPTPEGEETTKAEKLFDIDASRVTELTVKDSSGAVTTLHKDGGTWRIVSPVQSRADDAEVSSITSNLASAEIQRVIAEKPNDVSQFGLAAPRVDVTFRLDGQKNARRLQIGEKTATGGDLYARADASSRVVLIPAWLESTFDRNTFSLREKRMLQFDRDKVDRITVDGANFELAVAKTASDWKLTEPWEVRADRSAVESLLGQLSSGQMKAIVAEDPKTLDTYGLQRPDVTVRLHAGSASAALAVGREAEAGTFYARDLARPMVFTIDKSLADDLRKSPADYRPKELFAFRNFIGKRLEVTREGVTRIFEKKKIGKAEDATERWVQTQPPAEVDATKIDDFASRLADLRAESYVVNLPAGSTEAFTLTAISDGNPSETVTLYRSGAEAYAVRSGEPGAARVLPSALDELVKALDATASKK